MKKGGRLLRKYRMVMQTVIQEKVYQEGPIRIVYPEVVNLPNTQIEKKINSILFKKAMDLKEKEKGDIQNLAFMDGEYKVQLNHYGLLSILYSNNFYYKGAAHPFSVWDGVTLDLNTGQVYSLSDFFVSKSSYIQKINDYIKKYIKEKNIAVIHEFQSISDNQTYYLTPNEISIFFRIYEYTPYAYGFFEVRIPYQYLASVIKRRGPLGFVE